MPDFREKLCEDLEVKTPKMGFEPRPDRAHYRGNRCDGHEVQIDQLTRSPDARIVPPPLEDGQPPLFGLTNKQLTLTCDEFEVPDGEGGTTLPYFGAEGQAVTIPDETFTLVFDWRTIPGITTDRLNYISNMEDAQGLILSWIETEEEGILGLVKSAYKLRTPQAQYLLDELNSRLDQLEELSLLSAQTQLDCYWWNEAQTAECDADDYLGLDTPASAPGNTFTVAAQTFRSSLTTLDAPVWGVGAANQLALAFAQGQLDCRWPSLEVSVDCVSNLGLPDPVPAGPTAFGQVGSVTLTPGSVLSRAGVKAATDQAEAEALAQLNCFYVSAEVVLDCDSEYGVGADPAKPSPELIMKVRGAGVAGVNGDYHQTSPNNFLNDAGTYALEYNTLTNPSNGWIIFDCSDDTVVYYADSGAPDLRDVEGWISVESTADPAPGVEVPDAVPETGTPGYYVPLPQGYIRSGASQTQADTQAELEALALLDCYWVNEEVTRPCPVKNGYTANPDLSDPFEATVDRGTFRSYAPGGDKTEADDQALIFAEGQLYCIYCNTKINAVCDTDEEPDPFSLDRTQGVEAGAFCGADPEVAQLQAEAVASIPVRLLSHGDEGAPCRYGNLEVSARCWGAGGAFSGEAKSFSLFGGGFPTNLDTGEQTAEVSSVEEVGGSWVVELVDPRGGPATTTQSFSSGTAPSVIAGDVVTSGSYFGADGDAAGLSLNSLEQQVTISANTVIVEDDSVPDGYASAQDAADALAEAIALSLLDCYFDNQAQTVDGAEVCAGRDVEVVESPDTLEDVEDPDPSLLYKLIDDTDDSSYWRYSDAHGGGFWYEVNPPTPTYNPGVEARLFRDYDSLDSANAKAEVMARALVVCESAPLLPTAVVKRWTISSRKYTLRFPADCADPTVFESFEVDLADHINLSVPLTPGEEVRRLSIEIDGFQKCGVNWKYVHTASEPTVNVLPADSIDPEDFDPAPRFSYDDATDTLTTTVDVIVEETVVGSEESIEDQTSREVVWAVPSGGPDGFFFDLPSGNLTLDTDTVMAGYDPDPDGAGHTDWSINLVVDTSEITELHATPYSDDTDPHDATTSSAQTYYRLPIVRAGKLLRTGGAFRQNTYCAGSAGPVVELL